jgi:hypothetical protein
MSGPYATTVQRYRDLGWQGALPVGLVVNNGSSEWHSRRKSKVPKGYTGHDGRWPDGHAVARWVKLAGHCNIGLRLPDGFLGIDVDQYGDKRGLDNLVAYGQDRGLTSLPLTDTIRTTSRGPGPSAISWLRAPTEHRWRDQPVDGVEIIQYGHRYAIVWPSVHPTGASYQWLHDDEVIDPPTPDDTRFLWLPDDWVEDLTVPEPELADHKPASEHREDDWSGDVTDLLERAAAALWTAGVSAHGEARKYAMRLLRMELDGHAGATAALDELEEIFVTVVTDPRRGGDTRDDRTARGEWARMVNARAREKVRTTKDPKPDLNDFSWIDPPDNGHQDRHDDPPAPSNGGRYFSKKIGLHVATLADDITAIGPLAEGADDIVWSYSDGVWTPARYLVRERAAQLLGQRYRRSHGSNAEDVVRQRSTKITCDPVNDVVNFRNGLYLWQADQLRDHDPAVLTTVQLTVDWNPDAQCPAFDRFLGQVVPEDMVPVVWEAIGYLSTAATRSTRRTCSSAPAGTAKEPSYASSSPSSAPTTSPPFRSTTSSAPGSRQPACSARSPTSPATSTPPTSSPPPRSKRSPDRTRSAPNTRVGTGSTSPPGPSPCSPPTRSHPRQTSPPATCPAGWSSPSPTTSPAAKTDTSTPSSKPKTSSKALPPKQCPPYGGSWNEGSSSSPSRDLQPATSSPAASTKCARGSTNAAPPTTTTGSSLAPSCTRPTRRGPNETATSPSEPESSTNDSAPCPAAPPTGSRRSAPADSSESVSRTKRQVNGHNQPIRDRRDSCPLPHAYAHVQGGWRTCHSCHGCHARRYGAGSTREPPTMSTKPAGYYVKDLCEECGKWRRTVERFDSEYLCATCRKNHPLNMVRLRTADEIAVMRMCQMTWNERQEQLDPSPSATWRTTAAKFDRAITARAVELGLEAP